MTTSGPWGMHDRGVRLRDHAVASILLVDDDVSKRIALKAVLEPLDLRIVEADSGESALRRVMEEDFAVILLDVRMPDMDGFETAALIRRRRESELTPIIFITAYAGDEIGSKARYVEGAVDFMFAPVPPHELRAKVSVFVNLYLRAQDFAAQAEEVQASADQLRLLTDVAPIGIFRTDSQQKHVYTNPRWTEITGISADEAFGRDWGSILATMTPPGGGAQVPAESVDAAGSSRFQVNLPDSTVRIVAVTSQPILNPEGVVTGSVGTLHDVTGEAGAERERARFRSLVQNSRHVIAVIDVQGLCSYVSPGVLEVTGFSPEEVLGTPGLDFIHPDDLDSVTAHLAEIMKTPGRSKTVEVRTRTKQGNWIWIEIRAANRLDDPSIEGIVLNYHDIGERHDAVERLAQSEELLAEGQALSHLGSFIWDLRTDEVTWSDEQYRLLGFEPGSVMPTLQRFLEKIHPDDAEAVRAGTALSKETGASFAAEFRIVLDEGTVRWISEKGQVAFEDGVPAMMTGMSQDITSAREAEAERLFLLDQQKDLAAQLRMLLDTTGEGIFGVDTGGVCTFMNKSGATLLGGEPDEFVGENMHALTHHSYPDGSPYPAEECAVYNGFLTGKPTHAQGETVWRLDGVAVPVDFSSHPIGEEGSTEGAVVAFQDVTLRQSMELKLREREKLFRGAFDASQTGIALIAADGLTYIDVNSALCSMLGYSKAELLELDWQRITHPDDLLGNLEESALLREGRTKTGHLGKRYIHKDGSSVWVELIDSVVPAPDGSVAYIVTHVTNVTERDANIADKERLEGQLVQAQKMEAVGQLAGGIAHDFNNILSVILNYAQFAGEGMDEDDSRLADINEISKAGQKAATLVHQLLAFSRKEIVEQRVIDLNEVVTGVYSILSRSLGEDIDLDFSAADELPTVFADPGRIEQVLLNLAVNARDAMPAGGMLKISTGVDLIAGERAPMVPGEYVFITVRDTGSGMDDATMERIFDPFFTTKPRGAGTGMGLSSAYGIIEQAGGCLRVASELGKGTTFTLYLPKCDDAFAAPGEAISEAAAGGSEQILLVEDEDAVRDLASRILEKHGYDVVQFSSGAAAIEYCRENFRTIDLLLTDVVMPNMSGKELSQQASLLCVGLKTLFMSGYTDELVEERGGLTANENLISKPFDSEKLLLSVRSLLDVEVPA